MQDRYQKISVIDSHTEGEPTRLVYKGFPDLGSGSMSERRAILRQEHDNWRKAVILEPRGNDILVGALLCTPQNPKASAGIIFFNNEGYLGMCGHGTIGLMASLKHLGLINTGKHIIETPVGDVISVIHENGSVSVQNVPAYRYQSNISVHIPEIGIITGDIAWGGNWFFLVNTIIADIQLSNIKTLSEISLKIKNALESDGITGKDGQLIDHIELFQSHPSANSQNFVMCPGGVYDRSPCGTGTSAKLACLAADGLLEEGETWTQASVIGSEFQASYVRLDENNIIPTIRGNAYICAENTLLIDRKDPFRWGISVKSGNNHG